MTLQEIMNQITTLGGQIRTANQKLAADASNPVVAMDAIQAQQDAIADMQKRMTALQAAYEAMQDSQKPAGTPAAPAAERKSRRDILKSNEYARAFCYALKNGINPKNGFGNEKVKILYDALTEGGGSPTGTDGGFLSPPVLTAAPVRRCSSRSFLR